MGRSAAAGCPHILSARRPHVLPGPGRRAGIPHQLRAAVAKRDASARARTDGMGLRDWQAAAVLPVMSRGVTLAQGIAGRLPPMTRTPRVTNHTVALPRTGADRAPRCRAATYPNPPVPGAAPRRPPSTYPVRTSRRTCTGDDGDATSTGASGRRSKTLIAIVSRGSFERLV